MKHIRNIFSFAAFLFVVLITTQASCYYDKEEILYPDAACDTTSVTYSRSVLPIISSACLGCHAGSSPSFGISLDSYAGLKMQADNNKLLGVINHAGGFNPMPKNATKLSDCNIRIITKWVESGAPNN